MSSSYAGCDGAVLRSLICARDAGGWCRADRAVRAAPCKQRDLPLDPALRVAAVLERDKAVAAEREIVVDGDAIGFGGIDRSTVQLHRRGIDMRAERLCGVPIVAESLRDLQHARALLVGPLLLQRRL